MSNGYKLVLNEEGLADPLQMLESTDGLGAGHRAGELFDAVKASKLEKRAISLLAKGLAPFQISTALGVDTEDLVGKLEGWRLIQP